MPIVSRVCDRADWVMLALSAAPRYLFSVSNSVCFSSIYRSPGRTSNAAYGAFWWRSRRHVFGYNLMAEGEPIWMKSGELWVHCRGLALADFGRDPRKFNRKGSFFSEKHKHFSAAITPQFTLITDRRKFSSLPKQAVALIRRNANGLPCSVGCPTARPPAELYRRRRQTTTNASDRYCLVPLHYVWAGQ